jgi:hypothetical protein
VLFVLFLHGPPVVKPYATSDYGVSRRGVRCVVARGVLT